MEGLYIILGMAVLAGVVFLIVFKLQDKKRHTH